MEVFLTWLLRRLSSATIIALALLWTALFSFTLALAESVRGLDAATLILFVILATAPGWAVGATQSRVTTPRRGQVVAPTASLVIVVLGLGVDLILIGGLGPYLLPALRALSLHAWQLFSGPTHFVDPAPAAAALTEFAIRLNAVLVHLRDWLAAILAGQPAFDPVAASLAWAWIVWLVAAWGAGWVKRFHPLAALAPALGLLAFLVAYSGLSPLYLLPPLAALLLLMALTGQQARENRWTLVSVDFSEDLRIDLAMWAPLLTALLIALAAFLPSLSIDRLEQFVRDLTRQSTVDSNAAPDSFGLDSAPGGESAFAALRSPGLPRQHLIGAGPELGDIVVMQVSVAQSQETLDSLRYYWRSATYDVYTGRGWLTSQTEAVQYRPGVRVNDALLPGQHRVRVSVQGVGNLSRIVYAPGALVTVEADFGIAWRTIQDQFSASTPGNAYTLESLVAAPGELQLRSARNIYPQPILNRYLALPDSISPRLITLARQLTASEPTPYDRARAIESYLRAIPYTLDLPAPPPNVDVADYFIFDLQRGYCDYYATAMAVLARAAGLPARFVTGYASGKYDAESNRFTVTEAEAHSWVEIYFEDYGWVEFEPTGGRPPIERALVSLPSPTPVATSPAPASERAGALANVNWGLMLLWSLLLVTGALAARFALDWIRLGRLTPAQTVFVLYSRLADHADHLRVPRAASDTPHEFSRALAERLIRAPHRLRPQSRDVAALVELYVRASYSPHPPTRAEQRQAMRLWAGLNWKLWGMVVTRALRRAARPRA